MKQKKSYKKAMVSARESFIHSTSALSKKTINKKASRQRSTPDCPATMPRGPGTPPLIKTDSQSVSGGVIWSLTAKGVGLSVTVQKGVTTSFDAQAARHPTRARRLPCRQPISILHGPDHQPSSHYQPLVSRSLVESELPANHHQRASSAAICPSSTRAGALHIQS